MNLNKEESEQYMKVVEEENMQDMFDFGFALGRKKAIEEMVERGNNLVQNFFKCKNGCDGVKSCCSDCPK